jgi:phosphate transport system permease protein
VDTQSPLESLVPIQDPLAGIDLPQLEHSLRRPRTLVDFVLTAATTVVTLVALGPLVSVVSMLVWRGGQKLGAAVFTSLPPAPLEAGGGFGNAVVGTVVMVSLAMLLSVPLGLLTAIYLAQSKDKVATGVRFCAKVLTGFPSILAGVFAYGVIVLATGGFSAVAGAVALAVLMVPTIILTAEDAIRMVPARMAQAAVGMGATPTQLVWMVLVPTAMPGILTGVMLAVARAAGETAPLIFTALFSNYWLWSHGRAELMQPTASLAVLIYNFAGVPYKNQVELAWAAALVLVLLVLTANLLGQSLSARQIQE